MRGALAGLGILALCMAGYYVGTWRAIRSEWPTWSKATTTLAEAWKETVE